MSLLLVTSKCPSVRGYQEDPFLFICMCQALM